MKKKKAKIERLREAIKARLVSVWKDQTGATRDPVWRPDEVLTTRQTDIWNDIAVAVEGARHGSIVAISIINGEGTEEEGLENDILVAVTILSRTAITPGQDSDELLWESTIECLHNAVPQYVGGLDHHERRLRYQGFSDAADLIPDGSQDAVQLARQSTFKVRFSLEPGN